MQDFRKLKCWQRSHSLAVLIYQMTARFPKSELFGLTSQIRRAAISIPANIAEGCGRSGGVELRRFCQIALGSTYELESHVLLSRDVGCLGKTDAELLEQNVLEVKRMLSALIHKLSEQI